MSWLAIWIERVARDGTLDELTARTASHQLLTAFALNRWLPNLWK